MTLEQLIRQQVEDNLKKATRFSTEAAFTLDIWLRAIDREKAEVYSAVALPLNLGYIFLGWRRNRR